jgi:hypothetical protein
VLPAVWRWRTDLLPSGKPIVVPRRRLQIRHQGACID